MSRSHPATRGARRKGHLARYLLLPAAVLLALVFAAPTMAAEWRINGAAITSTHPVKWKGTLEINIQGPGLIGRVRCEDNSSGNIGPKGVNEVAPTLTKCFDVESCPEPTATAKEWHGTLFDEGSTISDEMWYVHSPQYITLTCQGEGFGGPNECVINNPEMKNIVEKVNARFFRRSNLHSNCDSSGYTLYLEGTQTISLTERGSLQVSP